MKAGGSDCFCLTLSMAAKVCPRHCGTQVEVNNLLIAKFEGEREKAQLSNKVGNDSGGLGENKVMTSRCLGCNAAVGVKAFFDLMHDSPRKLMLFGAACTQVTDPIAKASKHWRISQVNISNHMSMHAELKQTINFAAGAAMALRRDGVPLGVETTSNEMRDASWNADTPLSTHNQVLFFCRRFALQASRSRQARHERQSNNKQDLKKCDNRVPSNLEVNARASVASRENLQRMYQQKQARKLAPAGANKRVWQHMPRTETVAILYCEMRYKFERCHIQNLAEALTIPKARSGQGMEAAAVSTPPSSILSYADTHPMFTADNFPNFFRVVPSENAFNAPRLRLLEAFNWTRVGTIYQNEPRYSLHWIKNELTTEMDAASVVPKTN
ncbi:hypothetical protein B566_EDAN009814 [Ephemera danica]|nr:hypothetical protein B566_EDAN009814 [Ephemera danica]